MRRCTLLWLSLSLCLALSGCASLVATGVADRGGGTDGRSSAEHDLDARITNRINAAYVGDRRIPALDIRVSSRRGTVTLSGTLPTRDAQVRALQIARDTAEVRRVIDRTSVAGAR